MTNVINTEFTLPTFLPRDKEGIQNVHKQIRDRCTEHAEMYFKLGYQVFPLLLTVDLKGKKVFNRGDFDWNWKRNWNMDTFNQEAERLISKYNKWSGIGLLCGKPSNLVCLDRDNHDRKGFDNNDLLNNILIDKTTSVYDRSQSGGNHYFFKYNEACTNKSSKDLQYELRTTGTIVIIPPSVVFCGGGTLKHYTWIQSPFNGRDLPELPKYLYDFTYCKEAQVPCIKKNFVSKTGKASVKQKDLFSIMFNDCLKAIKGTRSEKDYGMIAYGLNIGMNTDQLWQVCRHLPKVKEKGKQYFDRIINKLNCE